jgi:hypothetical protein
MDARPNVMGSTASTEQVQPASTVTWGFASPGHRAPIENQ